MDPIRDGLNWYAYCGGDPVNRIDPWGLETLSQDPENNVIDDVLVTKPSTPYMNNWHSKAMAYDTGAEERMSEEEQAIRQLYRDHAETIRRLGVNYADFRQMVYNQSKAHYTSKARRYPNKLWTFEKTISYIDAALDRIQNILDTYGEKNLQLMKQLARKFDVRDVSYSNALVWFLEMKDDGTSFLEEWLVADSDDIMKVLNLLDGKEIIVDSFAGYTTHFTSNIDLLITVLEDITYGVKSVTGQDWVSFVWKEGYRTEAEGYYNSSHKDDRAVDLLNITKEDNTVLNAREQYDLLKYFKDTHLYNFIEWKNQGYHLGVPATGGYVSNPVVVHGSTTTSTRDDAINRLSALEFSEEEIFSCMTNTTSSGFYIVNFSLIDEILEED